MKELIYNFIKSHKDTSFAEINRLLENNNIDYKGNRYIASGDFKNMFIWDGMSDKYVTTILNLVDENKIEIIPCNLLIYHLDGITLDLPIAGRSYNYKKPH